jgi:hypothetical protein
MSKTNKDTVLSPLDLGLLLICSLRYSLGRSSYVVGMMAEMIEQHWPKLTVSDRQVIIRDVREALEEAHNRGNTLGMEMDDRTWRELLLKLESYGTGN